MKNLFSLIFLLLFSTPAFVQTFNIDGIIEGYSGQKVYLISYYGDQNKLVDSTITNGSGNFVFKLPQSTATGLYRIMYDDKDFEVVLNKNNVKFITDRDYPIAEMTVLDSKENQVFYDYLKLRERTYAKLDLLRPLTQYYPRDENFYKEIIQEYDSTQSHFYHFLDSLEVSQPKLYAVRLAQMEKTPPVNPFWSPFEERLYMQVHFFDDLDFKDTALIRSNAISNKIIGYLSLYQNRNLGKDQLQASFIRAVDTILKYTSAEPLIHEFALDYLISGFEQYNFNQVIEHIAENSLLEENCSYSEKSSELESRIETLKKLSIGNKAPTFRTKDIYGREVDLNQIKNDYKLLLFWASWCPHCTRLIPSIKEYYDQRKADLEIIAVSVDTSKSNYMKFISEGDYNWINIADFAGWDNEIAKMYGIHATPTLILLDSSNRIISKPMSVAEIKSAIE